jgi:hypothetical protein
MNMTTRQPANISITQFTTNAQRRAWNKDFTRGYRAEAEGWKASARASHPSPAYAYGVRMARAEKLAALSQAAPRDTCSMTPPNQMG